MDTPRVKNVAIRDFDFELRQFLKERCHAKAVTMAEFIRQIVRDRFNPKRAL